MLGILMAGACLMAPDGMSAQTSIVSTFNSQNVILPSSQYTPDDTYDALVWVFNEGKRYEDQYYNHIWGTPPADDNGRQWFAYDYDGWTYDSTWKDATSPFSSDEYYKGQKSWRWVLSDIMGDMYMRRSFTLNEPLLHDVFLACGHDDAPSEWYINGVKVHEVSDGWNNDEYVLLTDEQKALIKTDGTENVLAVHVHQNWGGALADCGLYRADMKKVDWLLPTVAIGPWDCAYYFLNYNDDLIEADDARWYAPEEDEQDWIKGVGPFSNDENMFFTTEWGSQVRPILVRRHFTLTATELDHLRDANLIFTCSYDENPVAYLNGHELWSANGWNDNNYARMTLTEAHKGWLKEGDNVLAVSLMQGGGGGHIDYGLMTEQEYVPTGLGNATPPARERTTAEGVYNMAGQYLGKSTDGLKKGFYIVNGKKCIIGK